MPFSAKNLEEKPYNVCLNCVNIGIHCDGPNFLAMNMERLSEWCRLRKSYLHSHDPKWTNAYIAEQTGMSKVSVDRFLSGNLQDAKTSTASSILKVLVNGTWGQYPCAMAEMAELTSVADNPELVKRAEEAEAECKQLRSLISSKTERIEALAASQAESSNRIEFLCEQMKAKDKLLDERADFLRIKDKYIKILSFMFISALLLIFALIVIDFMNPNMGFLWIQ